MKRCALKYAKEHNDTRPAFILGSGPSLRHLDPERIAGGCVIVCNMALLKAPKADYYFATDGHVGLLRSFETLNDLDCAIVVSEGQGYVDEAMARLGTPMDRVMRIPCVRSGNDLAQRDVMIQGLTCTNVAVCRPIVLLGQDCCAEDGKTWFCEFDGEPKEEWTDGRDMAAASEKEIACGRGNFMSGWEKIQRETTKAVAILNASGGDLEVFPRISLEAAYAIAEGR